MRPIHRFNNGVAVYDEHLIQSQRERYRKCNVHEAEEEELFVRIIRSLPQHACYLNIGGAIGYYGLLAKRLRPDLVIHTVEPLQRHRSYFIENISLNGFSISDFTIHGEAVGAIDGMTNFLDADYSSSIVESKPAAFRNLFGRLQSVRALLHFRRAKSLGVRTAPVKAITLDSLMARISRVVELVQMDVQGFELDVLRGGNDTLRRGLSTRFLIGTHSEKIHHECIRQLRRYDYSIEFDNCHTIEQPDGILFASKT